MALTLPGLKQLGGAELAERVDGGVPGAVDRWTDDTLWINPPFISRVAGFMHKDGDLDMEYLNSISAIDYIGHFELVYHLTSLTHNHSLVLKTTLPGRDDVEAPSVIEVWQAADLQEREVWDLMGVRFTGHPNLKRVLTWEGFPGHPLRKDHLGG